MRRPSQRHFAAENLDPRLRAGLVGHWIGGGSGNTWQDRSGYGNHGAIVGQTWTLGEGGKRNALYFDGSNQINFGTTVAAHAAPISVSAWIRPGRISSAFLQYFLARGLAGSDGWSFGLDGTFGGTSKVFVFNSSALIFGPKALTIGGWHHVAFTNTGGATVVYTDGQAAASGAQTITTNPASYLTFGNRNDFSAPYQGAIDDVRVYNRALSAAEIALLAEPSFLPVVPRRWFISLPQSTTAATSSVSTWVSPTASTRASVAASPSIASWASPTASTKASVSASPAVSTWVVPNATTRTPRIFPTVSVSRTVYSNIPASRTVYDPIEVS